MIKSFIDYKENYITFYKNNNNIKKYDIIIVIAKNGNSIYHVYSIMQVNSSIKEKYKPIFKEEVINKWYCRILNKNNIEKPIPILNINKSIFDKKTTLITSWCNIGPFEVKLFSEKWKNELIKYFENSDKPIPIKKKEIKKIKKKEIKKDIFSGNVPIKIIMCDEFKWPRNKDEKITYFKKHYKKCTKCEKINNNNFDLQIFFKRAYIKIEKVKSHISKETKIYDIIHSYQCASSFNNIKGYDLEIDTNKPYIEIFRICNDCAIEYRCLYICFMTNIGDKTN